MNRVRVCLACLLAALTISAAAAAELPPVDDAPAPGAAARARKLDIAALPVFGPASLPAGGWGEVVVRVDNRGEEPAQGEVSVTGTMVLSSTQNTPHSSAPFAVGVGASVSVRVPIRLADFSDSVVRVRSDDGVLLHEQTFVRVADNQTLLVDVARASALGAALRGVPVGSSHDPWAASVRGYAPTTAASVVDVASPVYDPLTGDPILPRRAAGYARVAAAVMRSDELVRLGAAELEALSGYLLAGGTLALVMARPEDGRHPVVVSLLGGEVTRTAPHAETLDELERVVSAVPSPYPMPSNVRMMPLRAELADELREALAGWTGGNTRPSLYGASAIYGLGEVHLLAFDPQSQPGVDSPWVHIRMVDLLRRANERFGGVLFRPGEPHQEVREVRQRLDPNEGARWAIVLAALLLCAYSIVAGPINFTFWRKQGHPLRALVWLPISAAVAFVAVVGVAVSAKGCSGRARHLTVVEVGAGMEVGTTRRWRGFFVPRAQQLTIRTHSAASVLGTEVMSAGDECNDSLVVDRGGLRLANVQMRPWETVVVREDGIASLGGGIALLASGSDVEVVNKTGKRLRGLLLALPNGDTRYLEALEAGASASSTAFSLAAGSSLSGGVPGAPMHDLDVYTTHSNFETASSGLGDAWEAVHSALGGTRDWFPAGVPVLLAQLDGGEGVSRDSGLVIDSDRVLIRVVGFGGTP